ncbi:diguanylate cyclase [Demequina sp.]|uniref:GGDEF domain-containing protein n=1 Tax=Demequina sp. TaxID=2050685 RepID=UPI003D0BF1B9
MGVDSELDAARLQLWEDRAKESRRQHVVLLIYIGVSAVIPFVLGIYYVNHSNIPMSVALVSLGLALAEVVNFVLAVRGHRYLAGVLCQLLPILPVLYAASAFSADAGFGSYLFIGALGVMVTIPDGHNRARYVCFAVLVAAVATTQIAFPRSNAWAPLSYDQTTALNTFNRTMMTIALFALALELTRSNRVGRKLVDQSLRIAELVATTDPLTGIANRRPVWERLESAALEGREVSVGLADMDHFKRLNDTYGHDCGDDALRHVAAVLVESLRADDLVARWGGEEFVLLVELPLDQAVPIFERARRRVAERTVPCSSGEPHHITLSIGVSALANADPAAAISAADAALYRAKEAGRDRVVI